MLERPKSKIAAREQLDAAAHAVSVAAMVIRSHVELLDAFADPAKRERLLAPFDPSEANVVAALLAPQFALALGFVRGQDAHVADARAKLAQVMGDAA